MLNWQEHNRNSTYFNINYNRIQPYPEFEKPENSVSRLCQKVLVSQEILYSSMVTVLTELHSEGPTTQNLLKASLYYYML